jgi:hypothetical protein
MLMKYVLHFNNKATIFKNVSTVSTLFWFLRCFKTTTLASVKLANDVITTISCIGVANVMHFKN